LASISCSFFSQPESSRQIPSELSPTANPEISVVVSASEGGELTLPDKTVLRILPDSLQKDTQVSIRKITAENIPTAQQELIVVGGVYDIDLGTDRLEKPATLEIPFDPTLLPDDAEPSQVFLSSYDENRKEWIYAGGEVDTNRSVVVLQITHASWWMPTTWNWGAWIAVLNKILRVSIVDWIEAVQLLTDDCPQTGEYVQVDSSQARSIVQGCVERDDAKRPELRVVNPRSFFFEVKPISGGNGYPAPALLSPGEDLKFEASTSDPSPLIIEAQMTERSSWYLVVHMVITMLPGANQFGIQGHHVACITERLADVSYFASAAESLLVDHNGAAAAESISWFMRDGDAVRRFITAADDCNFGPAPTWSVEGIRQIGGAVSTIMSSADYIAKYFYFAGNTDVQISFVWAPPISYTPTPPGGGGKIAYVGPDGNLWIMNVDGSAPKRLTTLGKWVYHPRWFPDGNRLIFTTHGDTYIVNADGSRLTRMPYDYEPAPSISPDGRKLAGTFEQTRPSQGGRAFVTDDLIVSDIDGGNRTSLTGCSESKLCSLWGTTWSPDGQWIAFGGVFIDSPPAGGIDIYAIRADGSDMKRLTFMENASTPSWSPDGRKIAFVSSLPPEHLLYVMNSDGSNISEVPFADLFPYATPTWSPDSTKLAVSDLSDTIYIINADGSQPLAIGSGREPAWSPR
jgi:hypothetical protein